MRNMKTTLIAVLALAGITLAGIEVLGIEVLGIEVLSGGMLRVETQATGAPDGSTVWAVTNIGGADLVVDMQPVDPMSGLSTVHFPSDNPSNRVELHGPGGCLIGAQGFQEVE